ncbi:GNAT family N-acetyltransferase [Hamadaea tsunoensis]|uniref:GNAT family N-acetyltransferase n=1 Tax=Hamadaea tsunoensis TaxID=53368 RepID=UPI000558A2C8|nr:GNAT family N-acetyltransferase [Hamadaea tsunoensis]
MVHVRDLREEDVDLVAANHVAAWRWAYRGIVDDSVLDGLDPARRAAQRREWMAAGTGARMLVAVGEDDKPIAHADIGPYRDDNGTAPEVGEVYAIYAAPAYVGMGAGAALMAAALDALPQPEVRLWVLEENALARRFYEKFGLRPDGVREIWTPTGSGTGYPELRYSIVR